MASSAATEGLQLPSEVLLLLSGKPGDRARATKGRAVAARALHFADEPFSRRDLRRFKRLVRKLKRLGGKVVGDVADIGLRQVRRIGIHRRLNALPSLERRDGCDQEIRGLSVQEWRETQLGAFLVTQQAQLRLLFPCRRIRDSVERHTGQDDYGCNPYGRGSGDVHAPESTETHPRVKSLDPEGPRAACKAAAMWGAFRQG